MSARIQETLHTQAHRVAFTVPERDGSHRSWRLLRIVISNHRQTLMRDDQVEVLVFHIQSVRRDLYFHQSLNDGVPREAIDKVEIQRNIVTRRIVEVQDILEVHRDFSTIEPGQYFTSPPCTVLPETAEEWRPCLALLQDSNDVAVLPRLYT